MYQQFAQVYDELMKQDIDYDHWARYIQKLFEKIDIHPKNIVDLACGTGNITIPLAQAGYSMVGIDISQEMLSIADQKSSDLDLPIQWLYQDMKNLQLFKELDACICVCDGMNYILEMDELQEVFQSVYHSLRKGGVFAFDMNSKYKIEHVLADKTFAYSGEEVSYIWENYYDKQESIIDYELSFFVKDKENYKRFNECHRQRAYSMEKIIKALKDVGFNEVIPYHSFTFEKPKSSSERIQYVTIKK